MNKIIITIGGLLLLGTLAAAVINEMPRNEYVAPLDQIATTTDNATLTGETWLWESSVDARGVEARPEDPNDFQLKFSADGTVTSTTDCNGLGGTYVVNGEVLSIGQLVATEMFCSEESLEQAYAGLLQLVGSHVIEGDTLKLILLKDAGTMTFRAKE
jgi:heat shock protein HslJ